ncbi:hypothetical protein MMC10_000904 [Thelotrema lepadinum]|nr:hypothetical protein [Thelotrema lepadinum]
MSPESAEYLVVWGSVATALHVSSDLLILGLPLIFIRNLQMSTAQKLSAGAVFALIAIDIVMGLMRNIIAATDSSLGDLTPNTSLPDVDVVLQTFEPSLAVIVCALPAYRSLLPTQQKRVNNRYESVQHLARPPTLTRRSARNAPLDDSITELERI